jgi:ParB family transcriptional regulator, chromosome partitioning protein
MYSDIMKPILLHLHISSLNPGRFQPRKSFPEESLKELALSIQAQGLIEPLIVRKISEGQYEIIAGERRFRAANLAKLTTLPCIIQDYDDGEASQIAIIENIQREDLNLLEEAQSYHKLMQDFQLTQEILSTKLGKSRSHIANLLRLLSLDGPVKNLLQNNQLSFGHARVLVGLDPGLQNILAQKTLKLGWSVRQLEHEVKLRKHTKTSKTADLEHLESSISEQIAMPTTIKLDADGGGLLQIKFYDNNTLSSLLERLGLSYD